MARPIGTVPRRQLGRQLKQLRKQAGLSLDEAAKKLDCSSSRLDRYETGQQVADVMWVRGMLDLYGVSESWEPMLALSRLAKQPGWWRAYGLNDRGYVPLEASATLVREFNPMVVPGLLQTPEYARALSGMAVLPMSDERVERDVEVRTIRQRRLLAENHPLELETIMEESVLHRPIGDAKVLRAQLEHLLMMAEVDTVTLRVLPTGIGAHPGLDGGFILLSFADLDEPDIVYVEPLTGSLHIDRAQVVTRCRLAFDRLRSAALDPADSMALVERVAAQT
ncbi:MAG: helix-turn-helix domain-containing protein [Pseudonocardia sp.]|nr:helix-turn-helix domain-containing protein [Pseudonocardia sp.]